MEEEQTVDDVDRYYMNPSGSLCYIIPVKNSSMNINEVCHCT